MNLSELAKVLIGELRTNYPDVVATNAFPSYVKCFRTVGLAVPRISGKTTLIKDLSSRYSSITIVKNAMMAKYIGDFVFPVSLLSAALTRGVRLPRGVKIQCFLIDEYDMLDDEDKKEIDLVIDYLRSRDSLTDDFFVFYVTTPR